MFWCLRYGSMLLGQRLVVLSGHVRHALGMKFRHQSFHSAAERMQWMRNAILLKALQHAISIGRPTNIHGLFGQFIHRSEIACQPVAVRQIEPIRPGLEKGPTRFSPQAEDHRVALRITASPSQGCAAQQQQRHHR